MLNQKRTPFFVGIISLIVVLTAVAIFYRILNGDSSLLRNVSVAHEQISPNADQESDITHIAYEISRNASVSIYFENSDDERFYFREDESRGKDEYRVAFAGVVDGYRLEDEAIQGDILDRLLQDGVYTWTVAAKDNNGVLETAQGRLTIVDADTTLPELRNFTVWPESRLFTPNRDGISDRANPQFYLAKDVEELRVFLRDEDGKVYPISEFEQGVPANMEGLHMFDYDAGVDDGATPPPDGTYQLIATARDAEGQRIEVQDALTIQFGGVPRVDIFAPPAGDTLSFEATAVQLCDTIQFTVTVRNYGTAPIRTSGPPPGTVYDSGWKYDTVGWPTESGVFRVGIGFENELIPYPYRWAVGNVEDLELIGEHYYLMPGQRAVVTGGIRVVDAFGVRNPQPMWAGLIHEDVEISQFNNHVDPHAITIDLPIEDSEVVCEERPFPVLSNE